MLALCLATFSGAAAELSDIEKRWLRGVWPVVQYDKTAQMLLDTAVQPQPALNAAPLALSYIGGRCKLVFSVRGTAQADTALNGLDADLQDAAIELMAAHELGHCQRYQSGAWHGMPAGFVAQESAALHLASLAAWAELQAARREEGYGDLIGLAWTERHRAPLYARLHGWLPALRSADMVLGSHHDTRAWVELARAGLPGSRLSIFDAPAGLCAAGLQLLH